AAVIWGCGRRGNALSFMVGKATRLAPFSQRPRSGVTGHGRTTPMSDKSRLLQDADEAFAELRQAVDGLDDGRLTRVWLGTWSIREILIHITGWHEEMLPAVARVARGEAAYPAGIYDDFDAWNARFV